MTIKELDLSGVYEITFTPYSDERGLFFRTFDDSILQNYGLGTGWVQDNHSINIHKHIIRGLHFMLAPHTDGKLVRCIQGQAFDVFVDLRKESPTLGNWSSYILRDDAFTALYLPRGFAHGFCTLTERCEIVYKHDSYYEKMSDSGIKWDDPDLNIQWPINQPMISKKDSELMSYKEFITKYGGL